MNCGVWRDIALNLEFFGVRKACESKDAMPSNHPNLCYGDGVYYSVLKFVLGPMLVA